MSRPRLDAAWVERLLVELEQLRSSDAAVRAAAALAAGNMVWASGQRWSDLFRGTKGAKRGSTRNGHGARPVADLDQQDHRFLIEFIRRNAAALQPAEMHFLADMIAWSGAPTERQAAWLLRLYARAECDELAAGADLEVAA